MLEIYKLMKSVFRVVAFGLLLGLANVAFANDVETEIAKVKTERTFKNLRIPLPVIIANAGDGSGKLYVGSQFGKVYVMDEDPDVEEPKLFLDIADRVRYIERENEEGFLGMAFHPNYKENGFVYTYYTQYQETGDYPRTSVLARFTRSANDPDQLDPASEQVILTIKQPFWNHNGGTICFGPDGYLYIALGDGGAANDPLGNGQNLKTWLGSILRIDVDRKADGKNYAIPKDNPFVGRDDALPEIYAYGLRNVWRMCFDPKTGIGYVADVGQNIWEEVNILKKGGNYGWNIREAMHEFEKAPRPTSDEDQFVDPIWEYHHDIGKSITGGEVYRGQDIPELDGVYLFADYITGYLWGLKYDPETGKVVKHLEIQGPHKNKAKEQAAPIITFGKSESGNVYFSDRNGKFYTFVK